MSEAKAGNLYDFNKIGMANIEPMDSFKLSNIFYNIVKPFFMTDHKYFMLLCHEERDYTLFNKTNENDFLKDPTLELRECLENRGDILSIEETDGGNAFEIWIRSGKANTCYFLFPYDRGVIEV